MKTKTLAFYPVFTLALLGMPALAPAAITYVGSGAFAAANNAAVTPTLPAGHQTNDILLVLAGFESSGGTMSISGYSQLFLQSSAGGKLYLFCKVHDGTESNPTVSVASGAAGDSVIAKAYVIRGALANCANIVAHSAGQFNGNGDVTVEYPALTITTPNTFVGIAYLHGENNANGDNTPAGFTDTGYVYTDQGGDQSMNLKYKIQTIATSVPSGTITISGTQINPSKSIVIALKTAPSLLYQDGFESGAISSIWSLSDDGQATHTLVATPTREGAKSHRCQLTWNSLDDFRCELSGGPSLMPNYVNQAFFTDAWFGFSIYMPTDPIAKGCIHAQWHGYGGFGPGDEDDTVTLPPLSLSVDSTVNKWKISGWSSPSQPTLDSERVSSFSHFIGDVAFNQWTDFVFRIRWDYRTQPTADGVVQVWVNGALMADHPDIAIGYNDAKLPYFKIGAYCSQYKTGSPTGATKTVYHDAVRIAGPNGSYTDVAPGQ